MFSHIFIGVSEFERAFRFYDALMESIGLRLKFCDVEKPWAGWQEEGRSCPLFVISKPYDGQPHHPGNGQMVAFMASDRERVRRAHDIALSLGGSSEGAPGVRAHYHADYYGAYFRDPDGNKLCVVCHEPEPGQAPSAA